MTFPFPLDVLLRSVFSAGLLLAEPSWRPTRVPTAQHRFTANPSMMGWHDFAERNVLPRAHATPHAYAARTGSDTPP